MTNPLTNLFCSCSVLVLFLSCSCSVLVRFLLCSSFVLTLFLLFLLFLLCSCSVLVLFLFCSCSVLVLFLAARWRSQLPWNQVRCASVSFYPYIWKLYANILHLYTCIHVILRYIANHKYFFRHSWIEFFVWVLLKIRMAMTSDTTFACLLKLALCDASPALNC